MPVHMERVLAGDGTGAGAEASDKLDVKATCSREPSSVPDAPMRSRGEDDVAEVAEHLQSTNSRLNSQVASLVNSTASESALLSLHVCLPGPTDPAAAYGAPTTANAWERCGGGRSCRARCGRSSAGEALSCVTWCPWPTERGGIEALLHSPST